jgi:YesN/AraC family two-component response regulator
VFIALNGYEALDYLRMEEIDLLITDIQMGEMSGIELMQQARLLTPWLQTIVLSAHETFQYAQEAMRLGAKDYLIKPIGSGVFLDTVRSVLLKMEKPAATREEADARLQEHFRMEAPDPARTEALQRLFAEPAAAAKELAAMGRAPQGPYFAAAKLRLDLDGWAREREADVSGRALLRYAALNIAEELLAAEWTATPFYSGGDEVTVLVEWSGSEYASAGTNKASRLETLGRSLHHHIRTVLGLGCVVGVSQIAHGIDFVPMLGEQASKALAWSRKHKDHYVFCYGDFHASFYERQPTEEEWNAQSNAIVEKAKLYIDAHYGQKGLTLHEVAAKNHVSANYLSYLFKKYTGFNLWEYVIKLRMEESRRLLTTTDLRRYEIAERVGYESPEHFSKIFKKYYGKSPSELKKE